MDRQRMERCLERVAAYRASGQKANVWAAVLGQVLHDPLAIALLVILLAGFDASLSAGEHEVHQPRSYGQWQ